jgi:hypothetical protein
MKINCNLNETNQFESMKTGYSLYCLSCLRPFASVR